MIQGDTGPSYWRIPVLRYRAIQGRVTGGYRYYDTGSQYCDKGRYMAMLLEDPGTAIQVDTGMSLTILILEDPSTAIQGDTGPSYWRIL